MQGILFTEILFHKTVNKEKTQTRREHSFKAVNGSPTVWDLRQITSDGVYLEGPPGHLCPGDIEFIKPRFKIGEVLYLKEPTAEVPYSPSPGIIYLYDLPEYDENGLHRVRDSSAQWQNKLFMGLDKARYFIKITGIKAERLFDINSEDCIKEGVDIVEDTMMRTIDYRDYINGGLFHTPQESYFSLFRFANKIPKSREMKNVWVWVYDYVLCDKSGREI